MLIDILILAFLPRIISKGRCPKDGSNASVFCFPKGASAFWIMDGNIPAVKLQSKAALTFLEKKVDIDIKAFSIVTWRWKVKNILSGIDERTKESDDHPIRIFFVFEPDESKQSLWFRIKRFLYLDRVHGHPMGGRFTEYLWSSHLQPGETINDPDKPWQKFLASMIPVLLIKNQHDREPILPLN